MLRKVLLAPLMLLAAVGFTVSLVVHAAAWLGTPLASESTFGALHVGAILLWFPAVLCAKRLARDGESGDFWNAALRGCPKWVLTVIMVFMLYAVANFLLGIALVFLCPGSVVARGPGPVGTRLFSGHWMVFYLASCALMYSYCRAEPLGPRCSNGHRVEREARFCRECGADVAPVGQRTGP